MGLTYGMEYLSGTVSVSMEGGARTRCIVLLIVSFDPMQEEHKSQ